MSRPIRKVYDEQPRRKMWDLYLYLESESAVRRLLTAWYEKRKDVRAKQLAYEKTVPFIYYLKQARAYYDSAERADLMVKPLLLYYGMTALAKAYVLTLDPFYPDSTRLLRHGMSTRKRKKADYDLMDDEIKIQKDGLLPHVLLLLGKTACLEEKYKVSELIGHLPQLYDSFTRVSQKAYLEPVVISDLAERRTVFFVNQTVLDHFHLSAEGFVQMLNRHQWDGRGRFALLKQNRLLAVSWDHPDVRHVRLSGDGFQNGMILNDFFGRYYIRLNTDRRLELPEFAIHFMLLFHLGMLARYEPERWGDIVLSFGSDERYLLHELLQATERYFPNLILNELLDTAVVFS